MLSGRWMLGLNLGKSTQAKQKWFQLYDDNYLLENQYWKNQLWQVRPLKSEFGIGQEIWNLCISSMFLCKYIKVADIVYLKEFKT